MARQTHENEGKKKRVGQRGHVVLFIKFTRGALMQAATTVLGPQN